MAQSLIECIGQMDFFRRFRDAGHPVVVCNVAWPALGDPRLMVTLMVNNVLGARVPTGLHARLLVNGIACTIQWPNFQYR